MRSVQHQFENDWQGPPGQINTPKSEFNIVTEILVEIEVALEHSFLHRIYSHASLRNVIYRLWQSRNRLAALLDRLVPLALRVQLTTVLPKPWKKYPCQYDFRKRHKCLGKQTSGNCRGCTGTRRNPAGRNPNISQGSCTKAQSSGKWLVGRPWTLFIFDSILINCR